MPHCFEVELAQKYGILEAILLNYFRFWIQKNEANDVHFHDGRYWTYNSVKAFCELFPYASKKMIEKAINHLIEEGLIITGNYNKSAYDRTKWYALTEMGKCISPVGEMECSEMGNGIPPQGKPIPVSNTNNNNSSSSFTPPTKEQVREYIEKKGYVVDPDYFFDYYESDDWYAYNKQTKTMEKMKNWKNKIVQWNKKELERNPQKAERPKPKSKEEIDREMAICDELRKKEREEFLAELNKH